MTCLSGHSSSLYSLAIKALFFSQTSEGIEFFISKNGCGQARVVVVVVYTVKSREG